MTSSEQNLGSGPRLRTVEKYPPPYPLNDFPDDFAMNVGKQVIYLIMTKPILSIEGSEWEQIFANAIGAEWKPSNNGLDDILLGNCAWGAKTIKASNPWTARTARLISGRNSPVYSYQDTIDTKKDPAVVGKEILEIWNERVASLYAKYKHLRTVVLLKSDDLLKLAVFEFPTVRYNPEDYTWLWNSRGNLEGWKDGQKRFTWQPHGSQFTITELVPEKRLCIALKSPPKIDPETVLKAYKFEESWVKIVDPKKAQEDAKTKSGSRAPKNKKSSK